MSFNKRFLSIELLCKYYITDPNNAFKIAIGKTDEFIFNDTVSQELINLWQNGNHVEANNKLKEHVLRISDEIS